MYQAVLDMGLSEFAVSRAIRELEDAGYTRITNLNIAQHIGCERTTVWRACKKLVNAGVVIRRGTKNTGYYYRMSDD